jgi:hypothetical protein
MKMTRYYTQLLRKKGTPGMELIEFRPNVLERYQGDNGPWKLRWDEPGHSKGITFYCWERTGPNIEDFKDYIVLMWFSASMGVGPAAGYIIALLKDLASLPTSEQEHWRKYQR